MVVQELVAKLGFQVDQPGIQKVDQGLEAFASKALKFVGAAYLAKKAFDGLVAGMQFAVTQAADIESIQAQFEVMLKSAEAAKYLVQEIQQFAAVTPFETKPLLENVKMMMNFGMSAEQSMKSVKMLGDVAGDSQERLNRLTLAFAQTFAANKLKGDDLRQYIEAGFNPLKVISQETGESYASLQKKMEKGLISPEMVSHAFEVATSAGGMFYQNMIKQSKTFNGLWSTAKDNIAIVAQKIGESLLPYAKELLIAFIGIGDKITESALGLVEFFRVAFTGFPEAISLADVFAGIIDKIVFAVEFMAIMVQQLIVDFQVLSSGIAIGLGVVVDMLMFIPKTLWAGFMLAAKGVLWIGELMAKVLPKGTIDIKGIRQMKAGADQVWDSTGLNDPFAWTNQAWGNSAEATGGAMAKFAKMAGALGEKGTAAPKIKATDEILAALRGKGDKPIVQNNIHNEVNVHGAEDPLKIAAESLFGKAFQYQFLAVQAASV